jgi:hypothetical protein
MDQGRKVMTKTKKDDDYILVVGNLGVMYTGSDSTTAYTDFDRYCRLSKQGIGWAADESVTLLKNGEPDQEFIPQHDVGTQDVVDTIALRMAEEAVAYFRVLREDLRRPQYLARLQIGIAKAIFKELTRAAKNRNEG